MIVFGIFRHVAPGYAVAINFFEIKFNNVLTSTPTSYKCLSSSVFVNTTLCVIICLVSATLDVYIIILGFVILMILQRAYK